MNRNSDLYQSIPQSEERLAAFLSATIRYTPVLTGLLALALLGVYGLAQAGLVGQPAWQMLAVAIASGLVGLAHLPIANMARAGRGYSALVLFALSLGVWSIALVLLWEYAVPVAIVMCWMASLVAFAAGLRGRWLLGVAASSVLLTALAIWLDLKPLWERLSAGNTAGLIGILSLSGTVILFVVGTIVVRLFRYRSLQSRLVVSSVLIMAIPVLFTSAISAMTAYSNSQDQFAASLSSLAGLKKGEIDATLQTIQLQMGNLQQGSGWANNALPVLAPQSEGLQATTEAAAATLTLLNNFVAQYPASQYEEIIMMDRTGRVVLSTFPADEGADFSGQEFYLRGSSSYFSGMIRYPGQQNPAGAYKLVVAMPIYGSSSQDIRGVLTAVIRSNLILTLIGPTSDFPDAQIYLVKTNAGVVSATAQTARLVTAWPIMHVVTSKQTFGSQAYVNHQRQAVLGYTTWDPAINAGVVAEIPQSSVFNRGLASLLVSGLVGLFAIIVAVIAALSSSQAISEPVRGLATAAEALAAGNLTVRAKSDQGDELGELAASFNSMADQLQSTIGNLEQRISERTQALEQQSVRLRTAAEVARDAASASSLDELLDQAARLIRDRFGFYHTGIFLLDDKKEFAILRASPSDPGKRMLENQHRLRVGEQGIVGRAAATGEPRIALDTGVDPVYFNNPLLPNTHSEMALPLKTADGTIGVIDIQSDQPEAFTQDDIAIVQVMADQLATAIQRTNLLQQVQAQLSQLEQSYQSFTEQSWRTFGQTIHQSIGYSFDNVRLESIKALPEDLRNAFEKGKTIVEDPAHQTLQVPLRLRGQVLGVVRLRLNSARMPEATSAMVQQLADRLATALENARLLDDSIRRANKERAIGEITAKISGSVNMRNVLQTAVEELGRAIPGSDVVIQFRPDTEI